MNDPTQTQNVDDLRPLLHAEIDRMPLEDLEVMHHVALQLELQEIAERLDNSFDADRKAGRLAALPEMIRAARASIRKPRDTTSRSQLGTSPVIRELTDGGSA